MKELIDKNNNIKIDSSEQEVQAIIDQFVKINDLKISGIKKMITDISTEFENNLDGSLQNVYL